MFINFLIIAFSLIGLLLIVWLVAAFSSMYRKHSMTPISYEPKTPEYFPTNEWQQRTPEEEGMNSANLLKMAEELEMLNDKNDNITIDSITIIRNSRIVADMYFNPLYSSRDKHVINSCAKSVISILIGIAIEKGHISGVDAKVLDFLPDREISDRRWKDLQIKDLLTMQSGLHARDSYLYKWEGLFKMERSDKWLEYILGLGFKNQPGRFFDYSNIATYLLSVIVSISCGKDTSEFAEENLFVPLGIKDVLWEKNHEGQSMGFARTWMRPHDMAKIGLLYLQKGKWGDKQVVSKEWVEESVKARSFPKQYRYLYDGRGKVDYNMSGAVWIGTKLIRPFADGYGYQWWLDKSGSFSAVGVGGQFITVVPEKNLVFVATSKLKGKNSFLPIKLLKKYIIPAVASDEEIEADQIAQDKLASYSKPPKIHEEKRDLEILPKIAKEISGRMYRLDQSTEKNPWQHNNLQLNFSKEDEAELSYHLNKNDQVNFRIGLDSTYRYSESFRGRYAAMGRWVKDTVFEIDYELIGYASRGKWSFEFEGDKILVREGGVTGKYEYRGKQVKLK